MPSDTVPGNTRPISLHPAPDDPEAIEWLGRVGDLSAALEKIRDVHEETHDIDPAVIELLTLAGTTRMCVAGRFGGSEVGSSTGIRVIEAIVRIDPAVAWQIRVQTAIGRLSDFLPAAAARAVFVDNPGLTAGGVTPAAPPNGLIVSRRTAG